MRTIKLKGVVIVLLFLINFTILNASNRKKKCKVDLAYYPYIGNGFFSIRIKENYSVITRNMSIGFKLKVLVSTDSRQVENLQLVVYGKILLRKISTKKRFIVRFAENVYLQLKNTVPQEKCFRILCLRKTIVKALANFIGEKIGFAQRLRSQLASFPNVQQTSVDFFLYQPLKKFQHTDLN